MQSREVYVKTRAQLHRWLDRNHEQKQGIWLIFNKGETRKLDYEDIIEELLCFGWIDSTAGTVDNARTKLYVAPRKKGSYWSKPNKERVRRLIQAGLIKPAGMKMIDIAKKTGTWAAMDDVDNLIIPKDLQNEFNKYPNAAQNFESFSKSVRKQYLAWITMAKMPETRTKRVQKTAERSEANLKF